MKFQKAVLIEIAERDLDKDYWEKLDELVDKRVSISRDDPQLLDELKDADCLLLGFQIDVGKDLIDAAPNLKYIGVLATAYGTIDVKYAASKNIPVCNLAGYSSEAVAEFTIAVILYIIRQIEEGRRRALTGNYDFGGMHAHELRKSQFGVIGLGSIGNRVAGLADGFGAEVSYWSRNKKETSFNYKELDDLLKSCDYISINVAETDDTTKLLNANNLSLVKPGAVIVSTVPPSVVDTDALAKRLAQGDITFISDHADEMPKDELDKLQQYDNCIFFPAIAFITDEARQMKQKLFVGNMRGFLEGKLQNAVDIDL